MAKKNKEENSSEVMNTRWWESYLVRYFVGFIVGTGCVATIASQFLTVQSLNDMITVSKDGKADWSVLFWFLSLAGLAYCYIASAPIAVLHAGRYRRGVVDGQSRYFWLSWIIVLIISSFPSFSTNWYICPILGGFLFLFLILILFFIVKKSPTPEASLTDQKAYFFIMTCIWFILLLVVTLVINSLLSKGMQSWVLPLLVLGYPIGWIGFAQYVVLWRLLFEQREVDTFYSRLFHARRQSNARDVRDTYTHLREHSNSVFIIIIEISLLALVISFIRLGAVTGNQLDLGNFLQISGLGVAIWVLPTVFMWSRANALENSFKDDPNKFLDS